MNGSSSNGPLAAHKPVPGLLKSARSAQAGLVTVAKVSVGAEVALLSAWALPIVGGALAPELAAAYSATGGTMSAAEALSLVGGGNQIVGAAIVKGVEGGISGGAGEVIDQMLGGDAVPQHFSWSKLGSATLEGFALGAVSGAAGEGIHQYIEMHWKSVFPIRKAPGAVYEALEEWCHVQKIPFDRTVYMSWWQKIWSENVVKIPATLLIEAIKTAAHAAADGASVQDIYRAAVTSFSLKLIEEELVTALKSLAV